MGRLAGRIATLGSLAVLATGVTPTTAAAGAPVVGCGQVITQSTVLQNDVGPCPANGANGIVVGASNITLDLNGHTVSGSTPAQGEGAGVYLQGRSGVTVKNGTVRHFDCGVAVEGGSGNAVTGITARDNIGTVRVTRCGEGIAILSSTNNRVVRNLVVHNGPFGGIGMYTRVDPEHPRTTSGVSTGNLIDSNQVVDNNLPRSAEINDSDGIRIETLNTGNTISNNRVTGSGLDGIAFFSFAPGNTASIILHGVFMTRPPVVNSTVTDNFSVGNNVLPPLGPGPLGGPTFDLNDGNPDCDNNVWLRNTYRTASPACTTVGGARV